MMKIFMCSAAILMTGPAADVPQKLETVDVTIEYIRDYEERMSPGMMEQMCRQRNCGARNYRSMPADIMPPARESWRDYQRPQYDQRYRDYQDFRSPYRYQYER